MNYLKEAILGTRNHRDVLLEYAKMSGGYKPKVMPIDGDDKIIVSNEQIAAFNETKFSYFVSITYTNSPRVVLHTNLCTKCEIAIQQFLCEFYGVEKCPYIIESEYFLSHVEAECGHENISNPYSYFVGR